MINANDGLRVLKNFSITEHRFRSAPDTFILSLGGYVQKANHGNGAPFLILRGLTGDQTLLFIYGIRLSNAVMG